MGKECKMERTDSGMYCVTVKENGKLLRKFFTHDVNEAVGVIEESMYCGGDDEKTD